MGEWRKAWEGAVAVVAGALLAGCYLSHEVARDAAVRDAAADGGAVARPMRDAGRPPRAVDAGTDAGTDAGVSFDAGPPAPRLCMQPSGVDLLLVLDDSGSIRGRDDQLIDRLPELVERMVHPPDADGDGVEDHARVTDLQVGIVNTSVDFPGACFESNDGRLRRGTPADLPHCDVSRSYGPILTYREGVDDLAALQRDIPCLAFGPRAGCSTEQPLEAIAKGLLPQASPYTFLVGAARGDSDNAGFLRRDSVLAILIVADEDDCSLADPTLFATDAGADVDAGLSLPGPLDAGVRPSCSSAGVEGRLHPIARYVGALRYLRPRYQDRLVLGVILAGVDEPVASPSRGTRLGQLADEFRAQSVVGGVRFLGRVGFVPFAEAFTARVAAANCSAEE